ncbi:MAG: glycosyltransferase, partial [Candidatus Gottesmanbacteria bacterium]|nr:glycosyltransferase [Candidatus Gottesmanbacteria bacterium]
MELSIIIVNFNTKDLTKSCLDSIHKWSEGASWEIIVVDNGSTDGS